MIKKTALGLLLSFFLISPAALAVTIDFEDMTGPRSFTGASAVPQVLEFETSAGTVSFQGGVVLSETYNLSANQSSLYGSFYGSEGMANLLTITFEDPVSHIYLEVYNGRSISTAYQVSSMGSSEILTLDSNLRGGTGVFSFASATSEITIECVSTPLEMWNFFIDNISFEATAAPMSNNVPVPGSIFLLWAGISGLAGIARTRS